MNRTSYIVALIGLILICFGQILVFDFVQYDDPAFIVNNPYVRDGFSLDGVKWAFTHAGDQHLREGSTNLWHPLTWMSHMLDHEIFGKNYGWHHLTNLVLHIVSSILVFLIFSKLGKSFLVGFITAALFAIHPLHVESVAWLSERKGLLSAALMLGSLYCYLKNTNTKRYSVILFILALLAKPQVVIFPALLLLIDLVRADWKIDSSWHKWLAQKTREKAPWLVPSVLVALVTLYFQAQGTHGAETGNFLNTLELMVKQAGFYIWRTIVPIDLNYHYSAVGFWGGHLASLSSVLIIGLIAYFCCRHKMVLMATCWALIFWLPVSGIVYVGTSFTSDRYTYLMLLGPFFLIGYGIQYLAQRHGLGAILLVCLIISPLMALSYSQATVWKNSHNLHTAAYRHQPSDLSSALNYAILLVTEKRIDEAKPHLQTILDQYPEHASAHYHLGLCYEFDTQFQQAAKQYEKAANLKHSHLKSREKLLKLIVKQPKIKAAKSPEQLLKELCELTQYKKANYVLTYSHYLIHQGDEKAAKELLSLPVFNSALSPEATKTHRQLRSLLQR